VPVSVLLASTSQNLLCTITCGWGEAARRKNGCTGMPALTSPARMSPSALLRITSTSQPSRFSAISLRMITARSERNAMFAARTRPRPEGEPPSEQSISFMRSTIVSLVLTSGCARGDGNIVLRPSSPEVMT
jgi:hypothetical protein